MKRTDKVADAIAAAEEPAKVLLVTVNFTTRTGRKAQVIVEAGFEPDDLLELVGATAQQLPGFIERVRAQGPGPLLPRPSLIVPTGVPRDLRGAFE